MARVVHTDDCWLWTGARDSSGYGVISGDTKPYGMRLVHRVSYEHHVGPIPVGLTLDHVCRHLVCVNPKHLQPVSRTENKQRAKLDAAAHFALSSTPQPPHPARRLMTIDSPIRPSFTTVETEKAHDLMMKSAARRDWSDVREALVAGHKLFFTSDQLSGRNVKYLTLALQRSGEKRTLHSRQTENGGQQGRLLWLD